MAPNISIIIVNWNCKDLLVKCLESIIGTASVAYEIVLIDNASRDSSASIVKEKFPSVKVIEHSRNLGFSKGVNRGIINTSGEFILVLNPDIIFCNETIDKMVNFMKLTPRAAAVGPKLLNPDGSVQAIGMYRRAPSLLQVVMFYTFLKRIFIKNNLLKNMFWEHVDMEGLCEVDQPPGACILVRRSAIEEVGPMDENFFLFFEDVDWCYRFKKSGWKLYYYPDAKVFHLAGGSWRFLNFFKVRFIFSKSMFYFFEKHHGSLKASLVEFIIIFNFIISLPFRAIFFPLENKRGKKDTAVFKKSYDTKIL